ncbi:MAG: FG-GAP repeat protein, partial [Spirochaetales bacterium]|nr:FG-GAP repeat protein [Spirochaetales bacterium]
CPGSFDDPTVANPVFTVDDTADYRTYPVEVIVSDGKTQVAGSVDITVENNPPFIFLLTATPGRLDKGEITELAVEVIDPDEDPLSFLWSTTCPGSFDNPMNQYPNFTVSNDAEYTEYSITIQVSDGTYNIEESIPVVVEDLNDPPVIKSINANPTRIPKGGSTQLEVYAVDPDQDELTYQWTATETGIFYDADTATPVFTVHDEVEYGECTITAYVTDKKETTTASITINIWDPGINQAPVILTSFQGTDEIEAGKQVIFRVRAKDPEGSNLTFLWKKTAGILGIPANVITDNYTESIMVWTAPAYTVNPVVIKVDISDEAGLTVTKEFLPVTIKQGIVPNSDPEIECKLELQDKSSNAMFGYAADIYANRIAASYVKEDSLGAVAVYEIIDNTFTRVAVLQASDEQTGDYYGRSLSIDQDIIAAGAFSEDGGDGDPLIDCGAVYIYERQENGNWIDKQILHASDAEKYDRFGSAIAVDNIYLAVGAIQEDGGPDAPAANCGAVYIYKRDLAGKWNESTVLYGSDKSKSDFFGCAVDIRENYLIVGAKGRDEAGGINNGVAYIFKRNPDDTWEEQTILRAPDSQYGDYFGSSVAISTSYAVVGAEKEDGGTGDPAKDCGAVYLFRLNEETGVWALASILHAPDKQEDDAYGCAVSLYNDLVIIGALGNNAGEQNDITDSGAVYIYRILSNEACSLLKKYYAPDAGVGDYFGNSVSVYGNLAVVGARGEDGGEENSFDNAGALYIIRF